MNNIKDRTFPTPHIVFSCNVGMEWEGQDMSALAFYLEELRVKAKEAVGYRWDNSQFYIADSYGIESLKMLPTTSKDGSVILSFWIARNDRSINDDFTGEVWTSGMTKRLDSIIRNVESGLTQCDKCGQWVKEHLNYSYCGAVCKPCYDKEPSKYTHPSTMGD